MNFVFDIISGIGKALGCFAMVLGAALIIQYADEKSRKHKHKKYQSILLLVTALGCYYPAHEMLDGLFVGMPVAEKAAFIIVALMCALTFFLIICDIASRD